MRWLQGLIVFAVFWANIEWGMTDNNFLVGAWGFCAAYALTVFPLQAYDWWISRHVRRAKNKMLNEAGIATGWRYHLPRSGPLARLRTDKSTGKRLR
jgi:hypothetical protein